jgi:hypothetical protein
MTIPVRILTALDSLLPAAQWQPETDLASMTWDTIIWSDPRPQPMLAELQAEADRLESVAGTLVSNAATIRAQAAAALGTNRGFLAIPTPSNAQLAAQLKELTRQNIGLIRLVLGHLDGTD